MGPLRFSLSKVFQGRKQPSQCWLPLLPVELRIRLLLTIGAQHNAIDSVLTLAREFPEYGKLVLVIHWSHGSLLDVSGSQIKVVPFNNYAELSKKQADKRPVKIVIKDFIDTQSQKFPSHTLDGSPTCALNSLINASTLVSVATISESASCLLLDGSASLGLCKQMTKADVHKLPLSTLVIDCNVHPKKKPSNCRSSLSFKDQLRIKGRPHYFLYPRSNNHPGRCCARDCKRWSMYNDSKIALKSLFFLNFSNYDISMGMKLEHLEVRLRRNKYKGPQEVMVPVFPTRLLHVTFEDYHMPIMPSFRYIFKDYSSNDCFVFQNSNWSPSNPYGLKKSLVIADPEGSGFHVEIDQAAYHKAVVQQRIEEGMPPEYIAQYHFENFKTVKLYGIPDPAVVWSSMKGVKCLYWWRLTPRSPDAIVHTHLSRPIVRCGSLTELQIISVIKQGDRIPLFHVPLLKELVLISLHESDIPWYLEDTLTGRSPKLTNVYMERRTDPTRDPPLPLTIGDPELKKISGTVVTLHIRGYLSSFVVPENNVHQLQFRCLKSVVLDISEFPRRFKTGSSIEMDDVTLVLKGDQFPVLKYLALMCTKEAYMSRILSRTKLQVTVGPSIEYVLINHFVKPASVTMNGQRLIVDESQYFGAEEPVAQGRWCQHWDYDVQSRSFSYGGQVRLQPWVVEVREY